LNPNALLLEKKLTALNEILDSLKTVVVAFSGGADSALLAAAAARRLTQEAVAITAYSSTLAEHEQEDAVQFAAAIGIRHVMLPVDELTADGFRQNGPDRCYHCKKLRFGALVDWARDHGFTWVIEGSNADDVGDYRPGMKALAEMSNVRSPLLEAGFTKAEIRTLSHEWNLPTWNKPSAACLASRIAYGQSISATNLGQVEKAESLVRQFVTGQVRVRHHGTVARIEVESSQMPRLIDPAIAEIVNRELKSLGFAFVTLDLSGYRMGSLNETL
jgi:pyridinium-3,5-biscarboxylic acid mononucleotide sulfurtransferase